MIKNWAAKSIFFNNRVNFKKIYLVNEMMKTYVLPKIIDIFSFYGKYWHINCIRDIAKKNILL
ncbi:MAG: hypothetical protein RIR02_959 [Pseudomonadota bacterium]